MMLILKRQSLKQLKVLHYFTLVELLVVIGIISILAGLLLPALHNAVAQARIIECTSNKKSLYQSVSLFTGDYNGAVPNQGMSVALYQSKFWQYARWRSEFMYQNNVRTGTPSTSDPVHRYWGFGKLWSGQYLTEGRLLFCTDDTTARYVAGVPNGQVTGDYARNFLLNGAPWLDDPNNWDAFPNHTLMSIYYISPWYLSESGPARSISTTLARASRLDLRPSDWPLAVDGHFRDGNQWTPVVPHQDLGVSRLGSDGRADFLRNPFPGLSWGQGHTWEHPSTSYVDNDVVTPMSQR